MRVNELLEAPVKGNWKIQNLLGVFKTFKNPQSAEARAWMSNRDLEPVKASAEERERHRLEREDEKAERYEARMRKQNKPDNNTIWYKVEDAVANSFPDGDPIDSLHPWMERYDLTMADIDEAVRLRNEKKHLDIGSLYLGNDPKIKSALVKKIALQKKKQSNKIQKYGLYDYLADLWMQSASDAISDAQTSQKRQPDIELDDTVFYNIKADGTIVPNQNPWQ